MSYVFPPPPLVPLVLSTFLAEDVTGQFILLVAGFWLLWFNSLLEDITCQCPVIKG